MKESQNKKRLQLFNIAKDGKGVSKNNDLQKGSMKHFFASYKTNFGKLVSTNIIMVLCNFPVLFLIATLSGVTKVDAFVPMQDLFQSISGVFANTAPNPSNSIIYALTGLQNQILVPTTLTYVFYGIAALTLLSFGIVNVGTAYILRNLAKGEPVFVWSDFVYAVKRNWKQALPFGIIDIAINFILCYNLYTLLFGASGFMQGFIFWANVAIFIIYFFMRYYIYVQMVTFKLSVFKIIKNSLIFSILGLKRNFVALFGIIIFIFLEALSLFGAGGILLPFAIAIPLCVLLSNTAYMKVYASYYKIKDVMIDPYLKDHPEEAESTDNDEVIMSDDVTEKERLEEIKRRNGIG